MIFEAIKKLYPTAIYSKERDGVYTAQDENYDDVTLDMVAVEAKAAELQVIADYQEPRKKAYDALNQLELISDDAINGTTTHADAILAIKAEFPKPNE